MPVSTIVDSSGKPYTLPRARSQTYQAAGMGARFHALRGSNVSATQAILNNATTLRGRAHELIRNNGWAWRAIESFAANCVGTGIKPDSQVVDQDERALIKQLWLDSTGEMDASGVTTAYGLQLQAVTAMAESGECFVRARRRRLSDGLAVPLQFQLLEADHVPTHLTQRAPNGNAIYGGIEFNGFGQRVAYHMYRSHPGDSQLQASSSFETVAVPASEVLHLFVARRPQQARGEPWLARTLLRLHDIDETTDAHIMKEKVGAMFAGFVRTPLDLAPTEILSGEQPTQPEESMLSELYPGTLQYLQPGEDITFSDPTDVGANFAPAMMHQLRSVAAGFPITYEQLTGDLHGVSFSSIRAGLIEVRRIIETYIRHWVCHQLCEQMWKLWIREAILSGALPFLTNYLANPRAYHRVRWITDGWEYVNPLQEVQAELMEERAGWISRNDSVVKRGRIIEELDEEIAEDNRRADQLSLQFISDPRNGIAR